MFIQDDEKNESGKGTSDNSSEQDDTDNEEDTSDDSDESSSDRSSDDEEGTDEEGTDDILRKYAKDPNSVPKELRGAVKKLLGNYTKKMQTASASIKKAEAFDQLVLDPEFRKWMEARRASISKGRNSRNDEDENDEDDEDSPVTKKTLRAELSQLIKQQQTTEAMRQEAREFKRNHPDWELYKDDIGEILEKHPTLGYEDAYRLVTSNVSRKDNMESKKRANVSKPNRTTGRQVEKKGKMTIQQAFEEAKRKMGLK